MIKINIRWIWTPDKSNYLWIFIRENELDIKALQ